VGEGEDLNGVSNNEAGLDVVADGDNGNISYSASYSPAQGGEFSMTDKLAGKDDSQRLLGYVETVAKESRKALTIEFNEKHKGIPFNTTAKVLSDSLIAWFSRRDKNLKIKAESAADAKLGEVRAVFSGETKNVRFRVRADATFSLSGGLVDSPSYLKELNVSIDRNV
jgi:predicted amino acid dehydrogenase